MSKLIKAILCLMLVLTPLISVQGYTELYTGECLIEIDLREAENEDWMNYKIDEGKVYFKCCLIEGADAETFEVLDFGYEQYGKDKNNVYYNTRRLDGLRSDKFKVKITTGESFLFYDENTVYFEGTDITNLGINVETFNDSPTFHDKNNLYKLIKTDITYFFHNEIQNYIMQKVEGGDPDNYAHGYKITDTGVYWYGVKIEEADVESFEIDTDSYQDSTARDKNNIYFEGEILYNMDPKSFQYYTIEEGGVSTKYFLSKNNPDWLKSKYPEEAEKIDEAIEEEIKKYEEKYPGYEPQPAEPPEIFTDIPGDHELYARSKKAKELGFISGYPDGSLQPDDPVNRAEFAKMLMEALYYGEGDKSNLSKFEDVDQKAWYAGYMAKTVEKWIMQGYPDGKMRPENTINRAEALKMVIESTTTSSHSASADEAWYSGYLKYAKEKLDPTCQDGECTTLPFLNDGDMSKAMTRGDCIKLILRSL